MILVAGRGRRARRRCCRRAAAISRAARPMRSLQSNAMAPRAGGWMALKRIAAATPGAARAPTRYREDLACERQQEFDPRGGAERAGAARLDVGGEQIFPDRQPAEHQGRERQAAAGAAGRVRSRPRRRRQRRLRTCRRRWARPARSASGRPRCSGRSTSRARRSTICCCSTSRRRSRRIRRRCGCCRRSVRRAPISRPSAGPRRARQALPSTPYGRRTASS